MSGPRPGVPMACLLLCAALARAGPTKFLQMEPSREEIDRSVDTELAGNVSYRRLAALETDLRTIYMALPKAHGGGLGHQAVRYVLHRFFVQQHGWYIRGIEPKGDTFSTLSPVAARKDWIAAYVQSRFEERTRAGGLDLKGLASLAATLEDIVREEASLELREVYRVLKYSASGEISWDEAQEVLRTYLMIYLNNQNITLSSQDDARLKLKRFSTRYSGWTQADAFLQRVEKRFRDGASAEERQGVDFSAASSIVAQIGEQFGSFNGGECQDLKHMLMGMEIPGAKTGRVRLVDMYNKSLYSHWRFTEKAAYLRELGALDESNASQPLVILPNYLSAFSNCLRATSLYAVCCRNECEDLMGSLEKDIASPTASAERIADLVSRINSSTVAAPRQLPARLLGRLRELAEAHGGEVHLHGRLFAQWMHHAFPRECPYPHEAGTTSPLSVDEFAEKTGGSAHVSEEEMRQLVADSCPASGCSDSRLVVEAGDEPELPWSDKEELLAVAPPRRRGGGCDFAALAALPVLALGWWLAGRLVMARQQRKKLRMVLAFLAALAALLSLDLLDATLFLPLAICVLLFGAVRHALPTVEPAAAKGEKCCV